MNGHNTPDVVSAAGWLLLTIILSQTLPFAEFSVAFSGLVLAELFSTLLIVGLDRNRLIVPKMLGWEATLGDLVLRWLVLAVSAVLLSQNRTILVFEHDEYAVFYTLGLCLILATIKALYSSGAVMNRTCMIMTKARHFILSVSIICCFKIGNINAELVFSLTFGVFLGVFAIVAAAARFSLSAQKMNRSLFLNPPQTLSDISQILFRYADIALLPILLSIEQSLAYLIARGCVMIVPIFLNLLINQIQSTLASAFHSGNHKSFVSVAARTNLGFLLIGGAASLIALSMSSYVPKVFNLDPDLFGVVLFWLLTAEVAPVIFGATGLLLSITNRGRDIVLLCTTGIALFLGALMFLNMPDSRYLAQLFAIVHLCIAAMSAVRLGLSSGIWPGFTALLFRQIKLL